MPSRLKSRKTKKKRSYHFGLFAEYLAAFYLCCKGYRILSLRYRNPKGEIDILAYKNKTLVAVEVKARAKMADCHDSITPHKQKRIAQSIEWLMANPAKFTGLRKGQAPNIRFDVVWVIPYAIPKHIKDAWRM
jgi:putative endonuclease